MDSTATLAVARKYVDAMSAKDFATVTGLFADDIVWHQPGDNRLSGGSAATRPSIRLLFSQVDTYTHDR